MNDLAIEIKKLADKYRNRQIDSVPVRQQDSCGGEYGLQQDFEEGYFTEFDDERLDELESKIANLDVTDDYENDDEQESQDEDEIQIADFINPKVEIVTNQPQAEESMVEEGLVEEDFDLEGQDRRSVSANIRNIAKNLRDLKALLREDI